MACFFLPFCVRALLSWSLGDLYFREVSYYFLFSFLLIHSIFTIGNQVKCWRHKFSNCIRNIDVNTGEPNIRQEGTIAKPWLCVPPGKIANSKWGECWRCRSRGVVSNIMSLSFTPWQVRPFFKSAFQGWGTLSFTLIPASLLTFLFCSREVVQVLNLLVVWRQKQNRNIKIVVN